MQYLKQLPNGDRISVTEHEYVMDKFVGDVTYIIRTSFMIVYSDTPKGVVPKGLGKPQPKLRYAGHNAEVYRGN